MSDVLPEEPIDERPETFISVDVETAGPNPSQYSLLSIGACLLDNPDTGFYIELKPVNFSFDHRAMEVGGFTLEGLTKTGIDPQRAMQQFGDWIAESVPAGHRPVFLAFNAVFDWMFVHDYFERFLGHDPFGFSALDMKAYYVGMTGATWARTSMRYLSPKYLGGRRLSHNALGDAQDQAALFRAMRAERESREQHPS